MFYESLGFVTSIKARERESKEELHTAISTFCGYRRGDTSYDPYAYVIARNKSVTLASHRRIPSIEIVDRNSVG